MRIDSVTDSPVVSMTRAQFWQAMDRAGTDRAERIRIHREYFGQFVTPDVLRAVRMCIGETRVRASASRVFEDIALLEWETVAVQLFPADSLAALTQADPGARISDRVCVLKSAAAMIRGDV